MTCAGLQASGSAHAAGVALSLSDKDSARPARADGAAGKSRAELAAGSRQRAGWCRKRWRRRKNRGGGGGVVEEEEQRRRRKNGRGRGRAVEEEEERRSQAREMLSNATPCPWEVGGLHLWKKASNPGVISS